MNKLKSKRKRAEVGIDLPQPQMEYDRAPQPTKLFEGESNSGADSLQEKMKAAAKVLVTIWLVGGKDAALYEDIDHLIFSTPERLFFKLNEEWVWITREYFQQAVIESKVCETGWLKRWTPEGITDFALPRIKKLCKRLKRVSRTLPRINRQEGGARV